MDTVLVTGGLGRSGRWIVAALADRGHEVCCVDADHPGWDAQGRENVTFRAVDCTDFGAVADVVADVDPDQVVHWAAIPSTGRHAESHVFENNVDCAHAVLWAAGRAGADVVAASSECTYGFVKAAEPWLPRSLPITEDHPTEPEDGYGLSKVVGEDVADAVARRFGVAVASLRPTWIQHPGAYPCLDLPDLAAGRWNYWSYVDVRDVASLVGAAVEADLSGHEAYNVAAPDTYLDRPTVEAVREVYGDVPDDCDLSGTQSVYDTTKVRERFDWESAHAWREASEEDVPAPELVVP